MSHLIRILTLQQALTPKKSIGRVGVEIALLTLEMKANVIAFEEAPE